MERGYTNKVELIGYYGSDKIHACSAWTSTSRDITPEKQERIPNLLKFLAEAGHHSPFEKSGLHFLVDTEIASHIHLLKHRIGVSINGESARYKELQDDKFYIPDDWAALPESSGQLQYDQDGEETWGRNWAEILENYTKFGNKLYHRCLEELTPVLGRIRAKESARFFKTYNNQIQADIMFNMRSFTHFIGLRHKKDAQKEIFDIADTMLDLVKNIEGNPFKYTIEAFGL